MEEVTIANEELSFLETASTGSWDVWTPNDNTTSTTTTSPDYYYYMENIYDPMYTDTQKLILAWTSFVPALLSLIGSSSILYIILRKQGGKKTLNPYKRLILGMSICDILSSIGLLGMYPWSIPKYAYRLAFGARGNTTTCVVAGFLLHMFSSSILYSAFLAIYHVRRVVFNKPFGKIIEGISHVVSIFWTIIGTSYAVSQGFINPFDALSGWCGLEAFPPNCHYLPGVDCIRGHTYSALLGTLFSTALIFFSFFSILICMALIIWKVWTIESQLKVRVIDPNSSPALANTNNNTNVDASVGSASHNNNHNHNNTTNDSSINKRLTREIGKVALLYIGCFFFTFIWFTILSFAMKPKTMEYSEHNFILAFAVKLFAPLQGFFNAFIYFKQWRKRYVNTSATR